MFWPQSFAYIAASITELSFQKSGDKKDLVEAFHFRYCKVIFILLYEIVKIYMRLIPIYS